jgi:hypothetical protein
MLMMTASALRPPQDPETGSRQCLLKVQFLAPGHGFVHGKTFTLLI